MVMKNVKSVFNDVPQHVMRNFWTSTCLIVTGGNGADTYVRKTT